MHEFHLLRRIVQLMEELAQQQGRGRPVLIRLRVSRDAHLAQHSLHDLQALFRLAAQGTIAERATLSLTLVSTEDTCLRCGTPLPASAEGLCSGCGLIRTQDLEEADMFIQDVEWEEPLD
ncbi:MAG: hypothetical protein D6690_07705 [Nitrospirae bacterium]|nr:MAG: hypothetical protein D6690_07705 [Nitrospirota bacterium]